jgi:acetyltransferase
LNQLEITLEKFFYPSSVAVIGVSDDPLNLGRIIPLNFAEFGYSGPVSLVGAKAGTFMGKPIYPSIEAVEDPVELAVILTPAKTIPNLMRQCGRKGIRRIIIESGGFGEFSDQGRRLSDELKEIAEEYGIRFIGPNCIGLMNSANGVATPFTPMKNIFRRGGMSIIAQSGGVALTLLFMAENERIGYAKFAAIGNKLNVDENEVLDYFLADPETRVVCMYLESINDGRRLVESARRSPKPIVVHKANISPMSRVIAQSHTEALANDDRVVDEAFRQCGIVRFRDTSAQMDFVKALDLPRMKGRNLAIVSRSGGHAVMAADAAYTFGFHLPPFDRAFLDEIRAHLRADVIRLNNPLDLGDLFDFDVYVRILEHTLAQENVDGILFMHTFNAAVEGESSRRLLNSVRGLVQKHQKPVAICVFTDQSQISRLDKDADLPTFVSPERAIQALSRTIEFEDRRRKLHLGAETWVTAPNQDTNGIRAILEQCLSEARSPYLDEALDLMRHAGLDVPHFRSLPRHDLKKGPLEGLEGPFAVKICALGLSHKSDKGGVVLGLADKESVLRAAEKMIASIGDADELGIRGVVVQEMVPKTRGAYEFIIGGTRDPQFGPVVLAGYGGVLVEVFAKTAIRTLPLSVWDVEEMIDDLPGSEILRGIRGLPPVNRDALKDAIVKVAHLMQTYPEIESIDVNPLIVSASWAKAADARVILSHG